MQITYQRRRHSRASKPTRTRRRRGCGCFAASRRLVVVTGQHNVPHWRIGLHVPQPHPHVLQRPLPLHPVERVAAGRQRYEGVVARQRRCVHENVGRHRRVLGPEAGRAAQQQRARRRNEQQQPVLSALVAGRHAHCCRPWFR